MTNLHLTPEQNKRPCREQFDDRCKDLEGVRDKLIVNGQVVPWSSTHKAFRDYLQNQQWAPNRVAEDIIEELKQKRKLRPQSQNTQPSTLKELTEALHKLKTSRARPDHNSWMMITSTSFYSTTTIYGHRVKSPEIGRKQ